MTGAPPPPAPPRFAPQLVAGLSTRLASIGNTAAAACHSAPRVCGSTLVALGTLAAAELAAHLLPSHRALLPIGTTLEHRDGLLHAIHQLDEQGDAPFELEEELLAIARRCANDRQCRADAINTLLERLPQTDLAQLQQWVQRTAQPTDTDASGWPPGARAAVVPWGAANALHAMTELLADLYTPEVAALQDDLEAIVGQPMPVAEADSPAAVEAQTTQVNIDRMEQVERLLHRDGMQVQRLPYSFTNTLPVTADERVIDSWNLIATIRPGARETTPRRRLLLVAHADMTGLQAGGHGALDNASGVAVLLHIARQLRAQSATPSSADATVDLLITSNEELGLVGARAYVDHCQQTATCPTLALNVDMAGRGAHGYVLSASDALHGRIDQGQPPYYLGSPPVSTLEHDAQDLLQQTLEAQGFIRHQAQARPLLTSDHLVFQNASLPALGLSQTSAADAHALQDRDQRYLHWLDASYAMDWAALERFTSGQAQLDSAQLQELRRNFTRVGSTWARLVDWRNDHAGAAITLIHGRGDQLHRVNPRMAVDFADALSTFIQRWVVTAQSPTTTTTTGAPDAR